MKKLDVNDYSSAHLTLILLLHHLVKYRSHSLAIYINEFVCVAHELTQNITETRKLLKICYVFNVNEIYFNIVLRRTEMTHQQQVSCSGSRVIKCAVCEWRQSPPLAFVQEKAILSTCSNKNDAI